MKTFNKFITALDYAEKTLLVLSSASSGNCLCSLTTIFGTPVGIANASINLVFLISNGIAKMFLKTVGRVKRLLYCPEIN